MNYALVFAAAFLIDVCYVRWMLHVGEGHAWRAGLASMAIGACSLLGLTQVVVDHWLAIPYLLGLGLGTVAGMHRPRVKRLDITLTDGRDLINFRGIER